MSTVEERVERVHREFVADRMGRIRQAGTIDPRGKAVDKIKEICERSLYHFCVFVLNRQYLTKTLHLPVCNWLMKTPPYRKLLLLPRTHAKTSMVSHGLPLHMIVQPENGVYMPWKSGAEMRIGIMGETEQRATNNLRVVRSVLEGNDLFRGFWPHLVWESPRRQAPVWNATDMTIPRDGDYPDPTFVAKGVGGAITGARLDAEIKDDLVSEEAANSVTVMEKTIDYHINSRALFDDQDRSLEYIIGTRWAVRDLYSYILQTDPTVARVVRSIIEDDEPIYPEAFTLETIERLKQEFGVMFHLLYMNNIADPDLVDFPEDRLRMFDMQADLLLFDETELDKELEKKYGAPVEPIEIQRGEPLYEVLGRMSMREEYFRARAN